jgi:hypothetical protein
MQKWANFSSPALYSLSNSLYDSHIRYRLNIFDNIAYFCNRIVSFQSNYFFAFFFVLPDNFFSRAVRGVIISLVEGR